jgi:hypothetical protein
MSNDKVWLAPIIIMALEKLYREDAYLISHNVSERSIVFRFGIYLQELANENDMLKGYNIDVEYNRNFNDPKRLKGKKNGAVPDLIIHKRGTNEDNLLIIEFKPHWHNGEEAIQSDINKLRAFCCGEYYYKNALFIILNRDEPHLEWIDSNDKGGGGDE